MFRLPAPGTAVLVLLVLALPGRTHARETALLDRGLTLDLGLAQVVAAAAAAAQADLSVPPPAPARPGAANDEILRRLSSGRTIRAAGGWAIAAGVLAETVGLICLVDVVSSSAAGRSPPGFCAAAPVLVIGGAIAVPGGLIALVAGSVVASRATEDWRAANPGAPVP
jgi:hypothetical protein